MSDPALSDLYTPAFDKTHLEKFHPDCFEIERLVRAETDRKTNGQTNMARSTRLVMLIK